MTNQGQACLYQLKCSCCTCTYLSLNQQATLRWCFEMYLSVPFPWSQETHRACECPNKILLEHTPEYLNYSNGGGNPDPLGNWIKIKKGCKADFLLSPPCRVTSFLQAQSQSSRLAGLEQIMWSLFNSKKKSFSSTPSVSAPCSPCQSLPLPSWSCWVTLKVWKLSLLPEGSTWTRV